MKQNSVFSKINEESISFLNATASSDERLFYVLFTLFVTHHFMLNFAWLKSVEPYVDMILYVLVAIIMWGSTLYLFFVIASWKNLWKKTVPLIVTGLVLLAATGFFSTIMSTNSYGVVMDAVLITLACGKDFKKLLRCTMCVGIVMLILAALGIPLGITADVPKPDIFIPSHSLGINYPNTWGYLVFIVLMIVWYLYLRHKPVITFALFWAVSAFMYFYILCRTIAGLTIIFPVFALVTDLIEKRADTKLADSMELEGGTHKTGIIGWLFVSVPYLAFAFMMFMSYQYEYIHKHFYDGFVRNLSMRFVQGGLYFETYGIPLVGNPYRRNVHTYRNVNGVFEEVGILDSSFASYMIMRGLIWMVLILAWLCLAHWKAIKKRDYGIIFLEIFILGFAMIERPGLEMWYNFVLLYPLAKVASKPGTDIVLDFPIIKEQTKCIPPNELKELEGIIDEADATEIIEEQ